MVVLNYDNVTSDKYLGEYLDIHRGFGRPKIVDQMIESRFDYDPSIRDAIYTAALQIEKVWREEAIRQHILQMSWKIMELEEKLKRHGIGSDDGSLVGDDDQTKGCTLKGIVRKVERAVPPKFDTEEI